MLLVKVMKKIILILAILLFIYVFTNQKQDYYVIPKDSIRFRIIANSNSVYDQYIKKEVKEALENNFYNDLKKSSSIEESRIIINSNISNYEQIIKDVFEKENYDKKVNINYGFNKFPKKEYKGVIYEEGNYESLVITIGDGEGDNFWCVLFPPICTLETEESTDIEYRFLIKDLFDKYILSKEG